MNDIFYPQVFCTGQLEAWVDLLNEYGTDSDQTLLRADDGSDSSALDTPDLSLKQWGNCKPVSMDASVWWSFGSLDESQSHCPVESRCGTNFAEDRTEKFVTYMAPNYNCWELDADR